MSINGDEVDAVPIERHHLQHPGYLEAMLECLRMKHRKKMLETKAEPIFYLEVGSKMNDAGFADGPYSE